jgi:predicted TIM-barrel fold metal-dependent hydrolase
MYHKINVLIFSILSSGFLISTSCQQAIQQEEPVQTTEEEDIVQLTLNNYRPVSLYNIPKTEIVTARFPVIDLHTHDYAKTDAEIDQWVKTMDEAGIAKSVIMSYATGMRFDSIYQRYSRYPDRFILFCGFDYTGYDQPGFGPAAVAELERCFRNGARGVGELGDKGKGLFYSRPTRAYGMHIDDPRMDPLLQKCGELGMPVSIHVAEPIWMYMPMDSTNDGLMNAYRWRLDNEPDILGHQEMVNTLENAVKKHPATTFIACHYANCTMTCRSWVICLTSTAIYMRISRPGMEKPHRSPVLSTSFSGDTRTGWSMVRTWVCTKKCTGPPFVSWKAKMNIFTTANASTITGHCMAMGCRMRFWRNSIPGMPVRS